MGCGAAGGLWRLGNYKKIEIINKNQGWKLEHFDARHVKYDMIKQFATFCEQFVLFSP